MYSGLYMAIQNFFEGDLTMKWILASQSPRRRELFSLIAADFEIRSPAFDENSVTADTPKKLTMLLAQKKAESIPRAEEEAVVGCDTVVAMGNEVLGKPENREDAKRMLTLLSGNTHAVYTGVCILYREKKIIFAEQTDVTFFSLSNEEIEAYLDSEEPYDKAGAYGIQGKAALFVERISGDYYNVVGLPVARLARTLCGEFRQEDTNIQKIGEKR